ncbi:MAG: ABC transporter permease, partial [Anaerotignum sp.]|nr:ABC transporter permease [Anaerotignum sp.]
MSVEMLTTKRELRRTRSGKLRIDCAEKDRTIPIFLIVVAVLAVISERFLHINWVRLASRLPDVGTIFWKLLHFDFANMDLIGTALLETISITVLSTLYSILLGLIFGMFAAENVFRHKRFSRFVQSFFTFLRAVPTPIWVLLMMVCLG